MQKLTLSFKQKNLLLKAAALVLLIAAVTVLIVLASQGKLFGSEADDVYDSFYAVQTAAV